MDGPPPYIVPAVIRLIDLVFQVATKCEITDCDLVYNMYTLFVRINTCAPFFGICRCVMSDEKGLFDEEKEVVEPMKNEPSSIEEEEMAEEKVAFERSDRGELMISYNT